MPSSFFRTFRDPAPRLTDYNGLVTTMSILVVSKALTWGYVFTRAVPHGAAFPRKRRGTPLVHGKTQPPEEAPRRAGRESQGTQVLGRSTAIFRVGMNINAPTGQARSQTGVLTLLADS